MHRKKELTEAIEDETRRLKTKVGDNESRMCSLGGLEYRIDGIDKASKKNDGVIAHLSYQIDEIDKASKKNADEIALLKAIIEKLYITKIQFIWYEAFYVSVYIILSNITLPRYSIILSNITLIYQRLEKHLVCNSLTTVYGATNIIITFHFI